MTKITPNPPLPAAETARQGRTAAETAGDFDALLFGNSATPSTAADPIGSLLNGFVDQFIDRINLSLNLKQDGGVLPYPLAGDKPGFPLTAEFLDTFGGTGPLPVFIDLMTQKLKLTEDQNRAFQAIAVRNKDIVKTPETVQKLALELTQAGIGYGNITSA